MYTEQQKKKLLKLARKAIKEEFNGEIDLDNYKEFNEKRGVFVTLKNQEKLRGCVGFPYPNLPLYKAIYQAAKSAAFSDPRFLPVEKNELKDIKIEISVLTKPKQTTKDNIEIGKHGLMCDYKGRSGLLLPQVAVENNFSKKEFLQALCEKAGLDKEKWKDKDFKLQKFKCEVFSE